MAEEQALSEWRQRLELLAEKGEALEAEGLPFPTAQIRAAFDASVRDGQLPRAVTVVKRGEALLARVAPDWTWVRELLRRADELRTIAETIGVDVEHLDTRVGHPRHRLQSEPLSAGSLEKAAASASLALAVLNDAIPKFCLQEAEQLGASIRRARDRGEDILEATRSFSLLLQAIQDQNLPTSAQRLIETRRAVTRIPRAPAVPAVAPGEEEEILLEARNLARRLQRIKGKARNAQSAARLMAQVRAAISEERRYGTPEEEIEALWAEVDRLTREKKRASEGPPLEAAPPTSEEVVVPELDLPIELPKREPSDLELDRLAPRPETETDVPNPPLEPGVETPAGDREEKPPAEEERRSSDEEQPEQRAFRQSLYVPYLPPDFPGGDHENDPNAPASTRPRSRYRPRP